MIKLLSCHSIYAGGMIKLLLNHKLSRSSKLCFSEFSYVNLLDLGQNVFLSGQVAADKNYLGGSI